ncbi:hypothetical protein MVEN_01683300 [Mycena venus]|uniref:F-box domain-containing protein n=1 Tax=Mycena venus TaxID=2733690 RepID=A0A8H7CN69_9AGAR|nr:hypothetical protein MVEN_01683300 [Mycena venus]
MPSLPDLPTELLMEMVKYYPELYLDIDASLQGVASEQFDGNDTLRALSQTCRTLRGIFLPVLWARVHACFTARNRPKKRVKRRAKMLERRMISIQKTSYVMPYIRSLSVTLAECNMNNWQPMAEFIRVLGVLPNLQHLTVLGVFNEMIPVLSTACQGKVFPSILSLAVDDNLAPIIPCFPNVETLTLQPLSDGIGILRTVKDSCQHVHTVNNIKLWANVVKCLRDSIPNVKRLSVWKNFELDCLRLLENMDNLSELRIRYRPLRGIISTVYGSPPTFTGGCNDRSQTGPADI